MDIRVKFLDYSFIQVECEDQSLYYTLREQYSFMSDNYMFDPRFKYGAWDGKIRLFKPDGTLPFGLLDNLVKFCNNMGYKIDVDPKCYNKTEITMAEFEEWLDKQEFWSQDSSSKEWTQITPYWYQKQAAYEGILNRRRILNLPTSAGKAQPLDRKILTPNGWSTMGNMKVGSKVLSPDGSIANVIAVHPQGIKDIYEITFKDGRKTQCCKEHLWRIFSNDFSKSTDDGWRIQSLEEIMNTKGKRTRYIQTPVIEYTEKEYNIHPYVLGVLIGDGSLSQCQKSFVTMDDEIVNGVKKYLNSGLKLNVGSMKGKATSYSIVSEIADNGKIPNTPLRNFKNELERLKLNTISYYKHIPEEYKYGSIEQRKQLLCGLIDTDGTIGKNGGMSFTTVSLNLANDIIDIVRSIGGFASLKSKKTKSKFGICYNVNINIDDRKSICSIPRKLKYIPESGRWNNKLAIIDIKKVEQQEAQCITLDSEDHLYITDDYIVTHNSLVQYMIAKWYLEHYTGKVLIIVPTQTLVKQMIADFREYSKNELPEYAFLGIMSGSKKNSDAPIYVSTWQSAVKMIPDWFEQFGLLQNDECHLATGKSINAIIERSIHTPFKIGLSGSLRDGKANMMVYVGMFGGVYKPVETHELMEDGQVTKLQINCLFVEYSDEEKKQIAYFKENENGRLVHAEYQDEISFINNHIHRNLMVCRLAAKLASGDENVFVMFRFEEHGKLLEKILKRIYDNDKIVFLNGTVSLEERDKAKIEAETRKGVIYIASYGTFSTGVSIKNLHHVIFAHPTKAKTTVLQSIGRVLRKHKSKAIATLWDIIDDIALRNTSPKAKSKYKYINYALDHAAQRIERYGQEKFDYTIRKVVLKY